MEISSENTEVLVKRRRALLRSNLPRDSQDGDGE